jgi:hypothetical protein
MEKQVKVNRKDIFGTFLKDVVNTALRKGVKLDIKDMPGTKREFISICKSRNEELSKVGESSISEYMAFFGCKFKSGTQNIDDKKFYEHLFREGNPS